MRLRAVIAGLGALLLGGCAGSSDDLNYYLLHSPTQAVTQQSSAKAFVHFQKISLPDYLKQRGLAMQTGPATVYFSATHVWAEPLASGISQSLSASLWQEQQIDVVPAGVYNDAPISTVALQVDDLIATANNEVVFKGHYRIYQGDKTPRMHRFDYRRPLTEDGFAHAVIQMRELVHDMAENLAANILAEN